MLMKKRLTYEAPEVELFLVRFENNILSGDGYGGEKEAGQGFKPRTYHDDF